MERQPKVSLEKFLAAELKGLGHKAYVDQESIQRYLKKTNESFDPEPVSFKDHFRESDQPLTTETPLADPTSPTV